MLRTPRVQCMRPPMRSSNTEQGDEDSTRTNLAREVEELVARELHGRAFEALITQAIALPDLAGEGKTLFGSKVYQNHKVTQQCRSLACELEYRVRNREEFLARTRGPSRGRRGNWRRIAGWSLTSRE